MKLIVKAVHFLRFIFLSASYFLCSLFYPFFRLFKNDIWLISEINYDARDNGYALFRYLRKSFPKIKCYYIIDKTNPYYLKISSIGKTIKPHSIKHFFIFCVSRYKISTIVHGCEPRGLYRLFLKIHPTGKNIALKHGIFKNLHPNYFKESAHLDLICAAAESEYKFILKNFHYKEENVAHTGLARFDFLTDNSKKENSILIMPTWRRWLSNLSESEFLISDFYKNWYAFLNSQVFVNAIKNKDIKVYFFVHPLLVKYQHLFSEVKNVVFLSNKSGNDLQEYLNKCKLLITDYSSVFFDFAYLRKAILFFQFDEKKFNNEHYEKGYFDYRKDGFGYVCENLDTLILKFDELQKNKFKNPDCYLSRINEFFTLSTNNNCKRIVDAILKV